MITLFPMEIPATLHASREARPIAPGEVQSVHGPASIAVAEGALWITQEGDDVDHVLCAGSRLRLNKRGRIVMQALRGLARYKLQA